MGTLAGGLRPPVGPGVGPGFLGVCTPLASLCGSVVPRPRGSPACSRSPGGLGRTGAAPLARVPPAVFRGPLPPLNGQLWRPCRRGWDTNSPAPLDQQQTLHDQLCVLLSLPLSVVPLMPLWLNVVVWADCCRNR